MALAEDLRRFGIAYWLILILPTTITPIRRSPGDSCARSSRPGIPSPYQCDHRHGHDAGGPCHQERVGMSPSKSPKRRFQQFVSLFENFFFDLLRFWLIAYPRSLGGKRIEFKTVLDAPDKDTITQLVVDKELNEVLYERPAAWFAYLEIRSSLAAPRPSRSSESLRPRPRATCLSIIEGSRARPMR